ncbi:MAG: elongation factor P--(R)-beta-lysine ligase [Legionella sp.]|nr:elongation factor P--(R)-beta-lysine ligase [Legionella sp.]
MQDVPWQPSASIETLRQRAKIIAHIRQFFIERHYLEVETPIMGHYAVTDLYLSNIQANFRQERCYLQTSPEYHMKRLLAAGSGPIFQLMKVFRDDELGTWHNPEFSLLEWYQLNIDHHALMSEVDLLLQTVMQSKPMIRKTYQQAFLDILHIDPMNATIETFQRVLEVHDLGLVLSPHETDRDQYLFLLMSHLIEPTLAKEATPVALYNFPPTQASLARIDKGVAQRFEVYYQGVELANGFHELTDVQAQKQRFVEEQSLRQLHNLAQVDVDLYLLAALEHGLPACSGVALGVDRLVALILKQSDISSVLSFDFSRT